MNNQRELKQCKKCGARYEGYHRCPTMPKRNRPIRIDIEKLATNDEERAMRVGRYIKWLEAEVQHRGGDIREYAKR